MDDREDAGPLLSAAVVGCGRMGEHHVRALQRISGVQVDAVVDADEAAVERVRNELGIPTGFTTLDELFERSTVDVAHIVTPPGSHASLVGQCIEQGLHAYVEKPFVEDYAEAEAILDLAAAKQLTVSAGHQLLFDKATDTAMELLPGIGDVLEVESFFSFAPSRPPDGTAPMDRVAQTLDILPHPTYLLEHFLPEGDRQESLEVLHLEGTGNGEVRGLFRRGGATGSLLVTLRGRPVDSFVRIVGTRGTMRIDYVRGVVYRFLGEGAISKLVNPYIEAWTGFAGTTRSLLGRLVRRQRFYPGLVEAFEGFYESVRSSGPSRVTRANLLLTVEVCQRVRDCIGQAEALMPRIPSALPSVAVTGGTGFLGTALVRTLVARGLTPLVLSRRLPPTGHQISGAIYRVTDLGDPNALDDALDESVRLVIHAAAETSGGWDAHRRNSIEATGHLVRAMSKAGITNLVYVSSIAVISRDAREPIRSDAPRDSDPRSRGAYVWGKLTGELEALRQGSEKGVVVRILRPAAIIDREDFYPPGKLGRQIGPAFVAVGGKSDPLAVIDVGAVAEVLAWMATHFDEAPDVLNLSDPSQPTRAALVAQLRESVPRVKVLWLPWPVLHLLNWMLWPAQKLLRPGQPTIDLPSAFRSARYATEDARLLMEKVSKDHDGAVQGAGHPVAAS